MSKNPILAVALAPGELAAFFPDVLAEELQALGPRFCAVEPAGRLADELARVKAEILLAGWSTPPLRPVPASLRYVCCVAGSVRHLVERPQIESGLIVTNWGGSISRTVAEAALWHILTGLRRGVRWTLAMHREGAWRRPQEDAASLFGRPVGLHGFGRVARELVRLLEPFGCPISVLAPDVDDAAARAHGVTAASSLEALFGENEVVVELAPLTPATRGLVTGAILRRLRPGSVFVNVGRGPVVDEKALVEVARQGEVYFGLDVFSAEPLAADSPLRGLPNVFLTPHVAGPTADRQRDAGAFALANLRAYCVRAPLQAVVSPSVYDAST